MGLRDQAVDIVLHVEPFPHIVTKGWPCLHKRFVLLTPEKQVLCELSVTQVQSGQPVVTLHGKEHFTLGSIAPTFFDCGQSQFADDTSPPRLAQRYVQLTPDQPAM